MKTLRTSGDVLTIIAPSGGVVSGTGYLIGTMFGVAESTQAAGELFAFRIKGKVKLPKAASQAWAICVKVYWDDTAKNVTTTSSGNSLIGAAAEVATSAASGDGIIGYVVLNGITI